METKEIKLATLYGYEMFVRVPSDLDEEPFVEAIKDTLEKARLMDAQRSEEKIAKLFGL